MYLSEKQFQHHCDRWSRIVEVARERQQADVEELLRRPGGMNLSRFKRLRKGLVEGFASIGPRFVEAIASTAARALPVLATRLPQPVKTPLRPLVRAIVCRLP